MVLPCPPCRVITKHEKLFLSSRLPHRSVTPASVCSSSASLLSHCQSGCLPLTTAFASVPALSPLHLPMSPVLNTVKARQ